MRFTASKMFVLLGFLALHLFAGNGPMKWLGSFSAAPGSAKDGDAYYNSSNHKSYVFDKNAWSILADVSVGPQGLKGDKGDPGITGPQGPIGLTGAIGPQGEVGPIGATGPKGDIGLQGRTGDQGVQGPAGEMGPVGPQGLKGDKGDIGPQGRTGDQGIQGLPGATGEKGDRGDRGIQGPDGPQGIQGVAGPIGETGARGDVGPKGPKGDQGTQGLTGEIGPVGPQGLTGATGMTGATGAIGPVGATGATGATGPQGSFPSGTAAGDMQYWNGASWVMIPAGQPGQSLNISTSKIPFWSQIPGTLSDIDGNAYRTIVIGSQEWTLTNLKTTKLNDGTAIPNVTDNSAWGALTTQGYCWYNNDKATNEKYGALYNWYAVNTGKLAPAGWRVPTDADWTALETYLIANGYNYDATLTGNKIAKSMAAGVWTTSADAGAIGNNLSTNNKSCFSALGGGSRSNYGTFYYQSRYGYWWSATELNASLAWARGLYYDGDYLSRYYNYKSCGFSVRLVRDLN